MPNSGRWIAAVKVIRVNRSPMTREWTADEGTGSLKSNQAIWVESADSVGFSMGFTCTAMIDEADAARFLYWYPTGSLEKVMDTEIRARIQQNAAEVAARYPLDSLRSKKQEMIDAVRVDVIPFFKNRGITVTTVSMFGGMTYENPEIQKAIDKTFIAQQEKVVNQARFDAQQKDNDRIELEAQATAERARREAQGRGDAKVTEAKAEAQSIREVAAALAEAGKNPAFIQLRALEVETARTTRWDGRYPTYYIATGTGAAPNLLLNLPAPMLEEKIATTRPSVVSR
jgi:regulator of protease activity HflC (stomatin/prohibitin superfamily)